MGILETKNLSFKYNISNKYALNNISFNIEEGDFVLVCGPSGCGKTTLLKLLKKELAPSGTKKGEIYFDGTNIDSIDDRTSASKIGFVMQNPNLQIVTDKVWHELAFGLESLGYKTNEIRKKVSEISSFFGINDWYHKNTNELSGGQKQLLSLASILVMEPKILLLDEPTSQLDPIASAEFINSLKKINSELGITIIIVEHRTEDLFPLVNKVMMMDNGEIVAFNTPKGISNILDSEKDNLKLLLPTPTRLFHYFKFKGDSPLTVKEGKEFIIKNFKNDIKELEENKLELNPNIAIKIEEGYFRYEKESEDILKGLSLDIHENEIISILGNNGAGKTTLLKILSATKRLYRGKYRLWGKKIKEYNNDQIYRNNISLLPQNPSNLFVKNKVIDDLKEIIKFNKELNNLDENLLNDRLNKIIDDLEINDLLESHPYDLSGGEMQKCALAKVLLLDPKIILLDEPTKGLDPYSKENIIKIIKKLKKDGKTIVIVTHDIEFASKVSDRVGMYFDGIISSIDTPNIFFSNNSYYTTIISRMSRNYYNKIITIEDAIKIIELNNHE